MATTIIAPVTKAYYDARTMQWYVDTTYSNNKLTRQVYNNADDLQRAHPELYMPNMSYGSSIRRPEHSMSAGSTKLVQPTRTINAPIKRGKTKKSFNTHSKPYRTAYRNI